MVRCDNNMIDMILSIIPTICLIFMYILNCKELRVIKQQNELLWEVIRELAHYRKND